MTQGLTVNTLHGEVLTLLNQGEADFYRSAQTRYTEQNTFTVASDLREVDRLVFYETLLYRWQTQLASGRDQDGNLLTAIDEKDIHQKLKDTSALINQIQRNLRLTLDARSEDNESVGTYLNRLKVAARQHGIRREKQLGRALELTNELFALAGAYKRSNPTERRKLGLESADDVVNWVLDVMKPEYDEIDAYFREHQQRFWVRDI